MSAAQIAALSLAGLGRLVSLATHRAGRAHPEALARHFIWARHVKQGTGSLRLTLRESRVRHLHSAGDESLQMCLMESGRTARTGLPCESGPAAVSYAAVAF